MASLLSTIRGGAPPKPKPWNNNPEASTTPTARSFIRIPKAKPENNSYNEEESRVVKIKYEGTWRREKELTEMIQRKIKEAEQVCDEDKSSDGCKVAWDEVEEICEAKANLKLQLLHHGDPLESFCRQHPQTEECRINYDQS